VAVLEHGEREPMIRALDETLLGLRPTAVALEPALAVGAL
jgi:hypothetical protein